jgi:hypothetical protein
MSEHNKTVSKESLQPESEQFDRWWNEQGYKLDGDLFDNLQAAFLAGQEAKEKECIEICELEKERVIHDAIHIGLGDFKREDQCKRIAAAIKARGNSQRSIGAKMNLTETYKYRAELAEAKLDGVRQLNREFCKTVSADLTAAHERIKELESQIADTERRVAEDMYQIFLNLLGEKQ